MALLEFVGVSTKKLGNINFVIEKGMITGVVFCEDRKSCLISNLISGNEKLSEGQVLIEGEDFFSGKSLAELGASYAQFNTNLFNNYTALDNLVFIAQLNDMSTRKAKEAASNLLYELGVSYDADLPISTLDSVNYRKLVVASAFISKQKLVVFNEIFKNLDEEARFTIQKFLLKKVQEENVSVMICGDDIDDIEFCDNLVFLRDKKVVAQGEKTQLFRKYNLTPISYIKTLGGEVLSEKICDISQMPETIRKRCDKEIVSANIILPTVKDIYNLLLEVEDVN